MELKKYAAGFIGSFVVAGALMFGGAAHAAPIQACSAAAGLSCIGSGNDNETNVEAALFAATGTNTDLVELATSGDANNITVNNFQFTFTESGGEIVSGTWTDLLNRSLAYYLTVKVATEFQLIDLGGPSNGGNFTWFETLRKNKFQSVSHVRVWGVAEPPVDVSEPDLVGILGLGLMGAAFAARRRREA